jgi:hypothetical protein
VRSALLQSEFVRLYAIDELRVMRRDAALRPNVSAGPQCNRHRQTALSLRSLLKNKDWLDTYILLHFRKVNELVPTTPPSPIMLGGVGLGPDSAIPR